MCNVLVITKSFESSDEKKKFESKKRLEITHNKKNAVIQFVSEGDKNYKKTIAGYKKKHPKATIHDKN